MPTAARVDAALIEASRFVRPVSTLLSQDL